MNDMGEVVQRIGMAAFIAGYGVFVATVFWRLLEYAIRRRLNPRTVVIGFYAKAVGTVGLLILVIGLVVQDPGSWPMGLLFLVIVGAPAIALLLWRPVRSSDFRLDGDSAAGIDARGDSRPSVHSGESTPGDQPK